MVFGAILGAVGSIAGSAAQNRADKKAYTAQMESVQQAKDYLLEGERMATPFLREAIAAIESAKQESLGYTAQSEFQGYRALQDAYAQGTAGTSQSLARRGLYNTTTAGAAQRGLRGQYARDVGGLGAALAGQRSQITMSAAQGIAAGNRSLGQLAYDTRAGLSRIQAGVQYQAPQGIAGSYGALGAQVGDLLGDAYGAWGKWRDKQRDKQRLKAGTKYANAAIGSSMNATVGAIRSLL